MRRFAIGMLAGLLLLALPVYKASAFYCCDPWGYVGYSAFVQAGASVVQSITSSVSRIVGVLASGKIDQTWSNGMGALYAEKTKQTAEEKAFNEGSMAVSSQLYLQSRAGEAAENFVPAPLQAQTVTNAVMLSEQDSIVRSKVAANDGSFASYFYSNQPVSAETVLQRHKPYCSDADVDLGRCDKAADSTLQNADINLNSLLNPGDGQYETLSDDEKNAALAFVKNVVLPMPVYRSAILGTGEAGKAFDAQMMADQAALSVAAHSFDSLIANRTRRHQE